jgi:hypothetical protein
MMLREELFKEQPMFVGLTARGHYESRPDQDLFARYIVREGLELLNESLYGIRFYRLRTNCRRARYRQRIRLLIVTFVIW